MSVWSVIARCRWFRTVEYKGHSLLEGARQADLARVKKYLAVDIVNFKHPYNGDSALVSALLFQPGDFRFCSQETV